MDVKVGKRIRDLIKLRRVFYSFMFFYKVSYCGCFDVVNLLRRLSF